MNNLIAQLHQWMSYQSIPLIRCGATGVDKRGRHETFGTLETLKIVRHTQPRIALLRWHADRNQIEIARRAARRGDLNRSLFFLRSPRVLAQAFVILKMKNCKDIKGHNTTLSQLDN
jgi:hypothetical protein